MANEINKISAEVDNTELVALEDQAKGKKAVEEAKAATKYVADVINTYFSQN